ncbi:MAG: dTDP-4-dehydrorhamnose reductase [Candidatus Omnitrophica bacterium]|nr:dTDP-4-dehydrorhamnose reductase [Candidatus Omnitrophota bacterium]
MVDEAKKRILITGINGMLGQDLGPVLETQFLISGIDLQNPEGSKYDYFCCDITNINELTAAFEKINPWLTIHGAAFTDVDGCENNPEKAEAINIKGTNNIVSLCKQYGTKLIYISTDYVFSGEKSSAYTIDDTPAPLNVYGRTKLEAEQLVLRELPESLIVRTSWLFGKGGKNFVKTIIDKSSQVDTLKVVNDQRGSPTHTLSLSLALKELISAVFLAPVNAENYGVYHVSNSENCTWYEFAKKITDLCDIDVNIVAVDSTEFVRQALRPKRSILDNSRYEKATKNKLCSWVQALQSYLTQG